MATPGTLQALSPKKPRASRIPIGHTTTVETMLRSMMPLSSIATQCSASWSKPRSYVLKVVAHVEAQWAADAELVKDYRRHQMREGLETLYRQSLQANKYTVAAYVMNLLCKLDGCFEPDKIDVQHYGAVGVGISLGSLGLKTPQEVQARIEELRGMLASQGPAALQAGQPQAVAIARLTATPPPNGVNPHTIIEATATEDGNDPDSGGA